MTDVIPSRVGGVGNVAKLVDRLSKDLSGPAKQPPDVAMRKGERLSGSRRARVRFSYSPKHDDELELQVDDLIEIVEEAEEGWFKGKLRGKTGLFPANFVEVVSTPAPPVIDEDPKPELNGSGDPPGGGESGVIQPKKVRGIGFGVDILGGGSVNLRPTSRAPGAKGEDRKTTIEFVERDGSLKKPVTSLSTDSLGSKPSPSKDTREYARVEYKYEASNEDELTLEVAEIVTILSKECEDPGWWYGEVAGGKKGVFPDNFVKIIPPDLVPKEKKAATVLPPAVPAKPKPGSGSLGGRSTTPEPHKHDKVIMELGSKANSLKSTSSTSTSNSATAHPLSTTPEPKKEEPVPDKPKKPAFPGFGVTGLAKPKLPTTTTATPSATTSPPASLPLPKTSLFQESLQKSAEKEEKKDDLPEMESDRLMHPTASRPKHPKRRPPSQVFLAQMGKELSPSGEERPVSPLASSSTPSVLPGGGKKPVKPPPPIFSTSSLSSTPSQSTPDSTPESSLPKAGQEEIKSSTVGESRKWVSMEEFLAHKREYEAYRRETTAKIAQLERHIATLTQARGTGDSL